MSGFYLFEIRVFRILNFEFTSYGLSAPMNERQLVTFGPKQNDKSLFNIKHQLNNLLIPNFEILFV